MNRRVLLTFMALLVAIMTASSAFGYNLLFPERHWASAPNYTVDSGGLSDVLDGDGGVSRVVQAIVSTQAWNGAGCGTVVQAHAGSVSSFSLGDGVPMIAFSDPIGVCTGTCLAATFTGYYTGGTVTDADIVTNTSFAWTSRGEDPSSSTCSGEHYIEGVMVHEIGHGLGLGHSSSSGATMLPSIGSCDNSPATTAYDDERGISDLLFNPSPQCIDLCEQELDDCIGWGGQDPREVEQCEYYYDLCLEAECPCGY